MKLAIPPDSGIRDHPSNWTHAPEKAKTHCFYCGEPISKHKDDCVVPQRTVIVEFKTQMVISMPASWSEEDINFGMNDSCACMSRYVEQLAKETEQEEGVCHICSRSEMRFIREATEEDHHSLSYILPKEG